MERLWEIELGLMLECAVSGTVVNNVLSCLILVKVQLTFLQMGSRLGNY